MPPSSSELISAVGHPLRRRILRAFLDSPTESISARDLARALDGRVSRVDYHLKTLALCGILRPLPSEDGPRGEDHSYGWALDVEAKWLNVVLEVWGGSEVTR
jgi:DNA-binding transcriptional ArsR family regulator